jgi:hypothetical protein
MKALFMSYKPTLLLCFCDAVLQAIRDAIGGEGLARYQLTDAQQLLSMAIDKIKDSAANMGGVSVHEKMLMQDRRVLVNDASAFQGLVASSFRILHNVATHLHSTVSSFQKTSNNVEAIFTRAVGRGYFDVRPDTLAGAHFSFLSV